MGACLGTDSRLGGAVAVNLSASILTFSVTIFQPNYRSGYKFRDFIGNFSPVLIN